MSYRSQTSSSIMVHGMDAMEADCTPTNNGALSLTVQHRDSETFSVTLFTGNAALSVELAAVINGALAKHNFLVGLAAAAASEAAE